MFNHLNHIIAFLAFVVYVPNEPVEKTPHYDDYGAVFGGFFDPSLP
jgi:hypothetical protein